jgi:hypothetical protein
LQSIKVHLSKSVDFLVTQSPRKFQHVLSLKHWPHFSTSILEQRLHTGLDHFVLNLQFVADTSHNRSVRTRTATRITAGLPTEPQ